MNTSVGVGYVNAFARLPSRLATHRTSKIVMSVKSRIAP